jgi:hypothetical protein
MTIWRVVLAHSLSKEYRGDVFSNDYMAGEVSEYEPIGCLEVKLDSGLYLDVILPRAQMEPVLRGLAATQKSVRDIDLDRVFTDYSHQEG